MLAVIPHLVLVVGMTSVLFLAWRADHPRLEAEPRPLKSTARRHLPSGIAMHRLPSFASKLRLPSRLKVRMRSVGKALEANAYSAEPA